ncbi:MAG: class I SAM-dependent methyltransferase [Planctomycetota bacterium]
MKTEKEHQESFAWERSTHYATYNVILGDYIAQSVIDHIPQGTLLDLACGDGTLTKRLASHYTRVVGVDASPEHLEKARKSVPNADFHEALIEDFQTDERFDGVVMVCLLEHVVDPVAVLRAAARFLKPSGTLMVHVPNAEAINRRIAVEMGTLATLEELSPFDINIAGHRRSYTMDTFVRDVEASGLQVTTTGGVFYKMLSTPQMDWFLANGKWEGNEFGWGRIGETSSKDWRSEFCRACYIIGRERPRDTNVIFACAKLQGQ